MISGMHAILYSRDADRDRIFFRDVLDFPHVDVGHGWLIFALPPAELAVHPASNEHHELFLMCDDVHAVVSKLKEKNVEFTSPVKNEGWGLLTRFRLPGGSEIGLYQPKHALAHAR
jgi:hypothetical protein